MRRAARQFAKRIAVVQDGRQYTFEQAWDRGVRLANALIGMGMRPGDRVAQLQNNTIDAADVLLACAIANLVRVPLYARNARRAHFEMIEGTGCRLLITSPELASETTGMVDEVPSLERIFVADGDYEDFLVQQSDVDPELAIDENDYHIIRHTGGTTGRSKGVTFSHGSWLAVARDWWVALPPIDLGDKCIHMGPISHGSGYFFVPMWISGAANVLQRRFDPAQALEIMERQDINFAFVVPAIMSALLEQPDVTRRDWSRLKLMCIGAAPIPERLARRGIEVFGPVLYQTYGQTEVTPATVISPKEWLSEVPGSAPIRSAGRATPYTEVRIVDPETREPLPIGAEGEIAVRAAGAMKFFWNDPAATRERLVDGWVLTSDLGRMDVNGYLYVLDRKQDMIISGGFNIYPAELENVILAHPQVIEVAVFPIPHVKWGETPAAVCVVRDIAGITEDEVMELCGTSLGRYKRPGKVVITTEPLPRTPVGKVAKKVLREPYWGSHQRRVSGGQA
ncbi:MAG: class I adenylate-forming enzyme family protein [Lautropia sp.]